MTAPETVARYRLIEALQAEFTEGFPVRDDRLHPSIGHDGTVIAVFPEETVPSGSNAYISEINLRVQFFSKWVKEIDPETKASPAKIEGYAERFRNMLRTAVDPVPGTGQVWYYRLQRISYPPDPTGNVTRFEAFVTVFGGNSALNETTG